MDWSTSKLLRIETGEVRASPTDVRVLAMFYGAPEKQVEQLVSMARLAKEDSWPAYRDVHQLASLSYFGFEAAASTIRVYQTLLVPGLFQTEGYAIGTLRNTFGYGEKEIARRWSARSERQERLDGDDPPEILALLDEGVVRRKVTNNEITRAQLTRLVELSERRNISIRVIRFDAGAHPGMTGPFTLLELPDPQDDDVLYLEHVDGDKVIREDPQVTVTYTERFYALEQLALTEGKTRDLLNEIIAGMGGPSKKAAAEKAGAAANG